MNGVDLSKKREYNIRKSNELIQRTRYDLTVKEQRIVLRILQMIQPTDDDLKWYDFGVVDFCEICGIKTSGKNYKDIKKALLSVEGKKWHIPNKKGNGEISTAWIAKSEIIPQDGTVRVRLDEDLKPYLLQLKEYFTTYSMYYTLAMRSKYSIRMYELFKSYENLGVKAFSVKELQDKLMATKYTRWQDFRRNVIEIAIKEINELSDISVLYELKKTGKQFTDIVFTIREKIDIKERAKAWSEIESRLNKPQIKGQLNIAMHEVLPSEVQDA